MYSQPVVPPLWLSLEGCRTFRIQSQVPEPGDFGTLSIGIYSLLDHPLTESVDGYRTVRLILDTPRSLVVESRSRRINITDVLDGEISEESKSALMRGFD